MNNLEDLLPHLSDEDRANFTAAVSQIGSAFASRTTIEADPKVIANLAAVREHVLSGGEIALNISGAIDALKEEPSISNQLIAAEVKAAEVSKIQSDTSTMSRQDRLNYARERGLTKPREDVSSTMTLNEHRAVLANLGPTQRMNYARLHGLT